MAWERERARFVAVCRRAFAAGMQISSGGNLSLRLDAERLLVKPSGRSLPELDAPDPLVTDLSGAVLEGSGRPTKEIASHLAIYRAASETGGVVHYHAPAATAFAVAGRELPLLTVHAKRKLGRVPVVGPAGEGDPELAAALGEAFGQGLAAALMLGHGLIAAGPTLEKAHETAELVEETARVALGAAVLESGGPA
jgi:L-ribulose-5-phosphate 4-epimerase